jgi:hypothetical protein
MAAIFMVSSALSMAPRAWAEAVPLSPESPAALYLGDVSAIPSGASGWSFGLVQSDGDFVGADTDGNAVVDRNRFDLSSSGKKTGIGLNYRHHWIGGTAVDFSVSQRDDTAVVFRLTRSLN